MYRKIMVITMTIVLGGLTLPVFAGSSMPAGNTNPSMSTPSQPQLSTAARSSDENLTNARESFLQKNYKAAAEDIRKTVTFMKTEETNASASGKKMLNASINELDSLADNVEKGTVTSVNTLDNAFSRARDAIASNSQMKTAASETREAIGNTSSGVKSGLSWTGNKLGAAASVVVKGTGWIVGKAIEGTGWVSKKTGSAINSAGLRVENFGKNIQPEKQQTMTE